MFVAAFSGKVTILSPNLDPKARVLHVTFRLFFRPGTKRGPRGDQEVPKATKKRPWGSPGVPKREPRRCPGYPKRVLGDLFTARWRGGRRQVDPPCHAGSMELGVLDHRHNPQESGSEENPYPSLAIVWPPPWYHGSTPSALKSHPEARSEKVVDFCCKSVPN
jgi:hypothetical protein